MKRNKIMLVVLVTCIFTFVAGMQAIANTTVPSNIIVSTTTDETQSPVPSPTPTPVVVADIWLYFSVTQKTITQNTSYISGSVDFTSHDTSIVVKVNSIEIAKTNLQKGTKTFKIDVNLKSYKVGTEVQVIRQYEGASIPNLGIWPAYNTLTIKAPPYQPTFKPIRYALNGCNLYKTNSTNEKVRVNGKRVSNVICKLKKGTRVFLINNGRGIFYKVKVNSKTGYVLKSKIKTILRK